jgi:hypothetical protein
MGLDSFWVVSKKKSPAKPKDVKFDPELHLCGGMFSGHGSGSFRGKVYDAIIEEVTGVTLYQKMIPHKTVQAMALMLYNTPYKKEWGVHYEIDKREYNDIVRMFTGYADAGASLEGWW